jgi:hypothetical protein
MRKIMAFLLFISAISLACAQNSEKTPPVIDIHVYAMDSLPNAGPVCPFPAQFTASDPKSGNEHQLGWADQDCSPALRLDRRDTK